MQQKKTSFCDQADRATLERTDIEPQSGARKCARRGHHLRACHVGPWDVPVAWTAHPFTCLALELLGPADQSREYTCLPGYEEAKQLEIHVHCNVQEGIILGEGVFVKVGEEADGKTRCQVTPRPPRVSTVGTGRSRPPLPSGGRPTVVREGPGV